jgi:hypothetical protein
LNKFNNAADEARMIKFGRLPDTKTTFSADTTSGRIIPLTVTRPKAEQVITDYKYFTPPPKIKTEELAVKPTTVKTIKSAKYTPKAIKKITKSFRR